MLELGPGITHLYAMLLQTDITPGVEAIALPQSPEELGFQECIPEPS